MTTKLLDEHCKPLIGTELVSVEKRDYSWFVRFGVGITVNTGGPWRLIAAGRIVATSEDHGHQFGLAEA